MKGLKLPITVEPYPDESLRGLMLRLAEVNGYPDFNWVGELAGISMARRSSNFVPEKILRGLSQISGLPENLLHLMGWWSIPRGNSRGMSCMGNIQAPVHQINPGRPRVCPHCLRERNYAKAVWEFTVYCVCPTHGTMLADQCPACDGRLSWRRAGVSRCKCGFDLRNLEAKQVPDEVIELHRTIHASLSMIKSEPASSRCGLPVDNLLRLPHVKLLELLMHLGNYYVGLITPFATPRNAKPRVDVVYRTQLGVAQLLAQWPTNFRKSLGDVIALEQGEKDRAATRQLGILERFFCRHAMDARFDFMRKEFADLYVKSGKSRPEKNGKLFYNLDILDDVMNMSEAAAHIRIRVNKIRDLLEQGILDSGPGNPRIRKTRSRLVVSRDSVERFLKDRERFADCEEAAKMLGISITLLNRLRDDGALNTEKVCGERWMWRYERLYIDKLLRDIDQYMVPDINCPPKELVSMVHALVFFVKRGKARKVLFDAFCNGRIHAVRKDQAYAGLMGFFVRRSDVTRFMGTTVIGDMKLCSLKEATARLGVDKTTMSVLLNRRLLKLVKAPDLQKRLFVPESDLVRFGRSNTTANQLARSLGSSPLRVTRTLSALRVKPLFRARYRASSHDIYSYDKIKAVDLRGALAEKYGYLAFPSGTQKNAHG